MNMDLNRLEEILENLHQLGMIIYLKKNLVLKKRLIGDPISFNTLIVNIFNFGKKKISQILEILHLSIESNSTFREKLFKKKGMKFLEKELKNIKNGNNMSLMEIKIEEINKTKIETLNFEYFSGVLEETIKLLKEEKKEEEAQRNELMNISQTVYILNSSDMINFLGSFSMELTFLITLLEELEIITKIQFIEKNHPKEKYLIPLLFPLKKPAHLKIRGIKYERIERKKERTLQYTFPFKISSVFKRMILRIRHNIKFNVIGEIYWCDGFIFNLLLNEKDDLNDSTIVEMNTVSDKDKKYIV
eukprot:TRINITY_DN15574_c0_g1_i1.p1 TRINITY_DN15574_c0_g1~~TRINITY_DN15574_c0_g1_i1.p1  ORF type:complete len:351 (-),score=92.82 TRINITY_DN15574_c0_g1_i1:129-1037(-)